MTGKEEGSECSKNKRKERPDKVTKNLIESKASMGAADIWNSVNAEENFTQNEENLNLENAEGFLPENVIRMCGGELDYLFDSGKWEIELIPLLANEIKRRIIGIVKKAKYFSLILDCSVDVTLEQQMSLIVRCVDTSASPIAVEEFFIGFLNGVETSREALYNELKTVLGNLNFNDVRGHSYDFSSNMREKYNYVSSKVLQEYPRAFYTASSCHSLKIVLCDVATGSNEVSLFFGMIRRLYRLFSTSRREWDVLKSYVKLRNGKDLKIISDTRWESHFASVEALRFQAPKIGDALLHLAEHSGDAITTSIAVGMVDFEFYNFDFLVGVVIWFEILQKVNKVSKVLQGENMDIDKTIDLLKDLILFFEEYKETGFQIAKVEAEKIASEMEVEPKFHETRARNKKKFDDNARDEAVQSDEEYFRSKIFSKLVESAIYALQTRYGQLQEYNNTFEFLLNMSKVRTACDERLKCWCTTLGEKLKHGNKIDIDSEELFSELQMMRKLCPDKLTKPIEVLEYIKSYQICFPCVWIAIRIMLTIPITVATTAGKGLSKLKLIKSYLRSNTSEERPNGLATLFIERKMLTELDFSDLITNFADENARV